MLSSFQQSVAGTTLLPSIGTDVSVGEIVFVPPFAVEGVTRNPYRRLSRILLAGKAALRRAIGHIVSLCSEEKMLRVYASRIVAMMQNIHTEWDITDKIEVCNAVSAKPLPTHPNAAISPIGERTHPIPAITRHTKIMSQRPTLRQMNHKRPTLGRIYG